MSSHHCKHAKGVETMSAACAAAPAPAEGHGAAAAACNGAALTKNQKKKLKKKLKKVPDGGGASAALEDDSAADSGTLDSSPGAASASRQPMPLDSQGLGLPSEAPAGPAAMRDAAAGGGACGAAGAAGASGGCGGGLAAAAQAGDGFDGRSAVPLLLEDGVFAWQATMTALHGYRLFALAFIYTAFVGQLSFAAGRSAPRAAPCTPCCSAPLCWTPKPSHNLCRGHANGAAAAVAAGGEREGAGAQAAAPADLAERLLRAECKVVDFGNACWVHKQFTTDIQTRQYRCPEARRANSHCVPEDRGERKCGLLCTHSSCMKCALDAFCRRPRTHVSDNTCCIPSSPAVGIWAAGFP